MPQMLLEAPKTLAAWTHFFARADIPILRRTAQELDQLRPLEDSIDAQSIANVAMQDPLMTLKVLAHMSTHKARRQLSDIETVEACVVMMGVPAFFKTFSRVPLVEDQLREHASARLGLLRVLARAYRASIFARDWAVWRRDLDVEVIMIAALLHDLSEMLVWCFAPTLALRIAELQRAEPTLRSVLAQQRVLNIELNNLQVALMTHWRMPELLVRMTDDKHADHPQVHNVRYAVNLARHSAKGWDNPALPDDYRDVARLLNSTPEHVRALVCPQAESAA